MADHCLDYDEIDRRSGKMEIYHEKIKEMRLENADLSEDLAKVYKKIDILSRNLVKYKMGKKILGSQQKKLVRDIFIAEGKVTVLPMRKKNKSSNVKTEKSRVEKSIENLPEREQAEMLNMLLAMREDRQKTQMEK